MHRIPGHEGACRAFHGHRYAAEVEASARNLDDIGRVVDFSILKTVLGAWIDEHFDHTALLWREDDSAAAREIVRFNEACGKPVYLMDAPPTCENIAIELGRVATRLFADYPIRITRIRLWETPNCSAIWQDGETLPDGAS